MNVLNKLEEICTGQLTPIKKLNDLIKNYPYIIKKIKVIYTMNDQHKLIAHLLDSDSQNEFIIYLPDTFYNKLSDEILDELDNIPPLSKFIYKGKKELKNGHSKHIFSFTV